MTTPKYNLKNPGNVLLKINACLLTTCIGVKRIMQEAKELATDSTFEYSAHPLEASLH